MILTRFGFGEPALAAVYEIFRGGSITVGRRVGEVGELGASSPPTVPPLIDPLACISSSACLRTA